MLPPAVWKREAVRPRGSHRDDRSLLPAPQRQPTGVGERTAHGRHTVMTSEAVGQTRHSGPAPALVPRILGASPGPSRKSASTCRVGTGGEGRSHKSLCFTREATCLLLITCPVGGSAEQLWIGRLLSSTWRAQPPTGIPHGGLRRGSWEGADRLTQAVSFSYGAFLIHLAWSVPPDVHLASSSPFRSHWKCHFLFGDC